MNSHLSQMIFSQCSVDVSLARCGRTTQTSSGKSPWTAMSLNQIRLPLLSMCQLQCIGVTLDCNVFELNQELWRSRVNVLVDEFQEKVCLSKIFSFSQLQGGGQCEGWVHWDGPRGQIVDLPQRSHVLPHCLYNHW